MVLVQDLSDADTIERFVANLKADGGGDTAEATLDGLHAAVNSIKWREIS